MTAHDAWLESIKNTLDELLRWAESLDVKSLAKLDARLDDFNDEIRDLIHDEQEKGGEG